MKRTIKRSALYIRFDIHFINPFFLKKKKEIVRHCNQKNQYGRLKIKKKVKNSIFATII